MIARLLYGLDVVRTTTYLYNDFGEQVGTVLDGVTSRSDTTYEQISNEWWKVETASVIGPHTNSLAITRTQLTGLSDACRRHIVTTTGTTGILPVATFDYAPCGDLIAKHTYTNCTDVITESYAYDILGNRIATTDALGNTIHRTYDPFGNVIAEDGATYPVRYTYDTQNRRTSLSTTRDGTTWDTTTWTYDAATGNCLSKTCADNSTVTYTYTPDNLPLRTTYASGRWKENVYDSQRRLCGVIYSSPDMDCDLHLDEYGRTTFASNGVAQTGYALNYAGDATNETWATDNAIDTISRTFDGAERLTGLAITGQDYAQYLDYFTNGLLTSISNSDAVVACNYSPDLKDVGYTMAFADGGTFASVAVRDPYRRDLVLSVANSCGGNMHTLEYSYDALSRPISRNADTFDYNARSIADILSSAAIARAIDIGITILTLRADPRVSAVFAVDGTIGFIINARAHAKIMEGANKAKSENCSCSQYGY